MRRLLTIAPLLLVAACSTNPPQPVHPKGPNVILIMTDDQGYGDFGFAGDPVLQTPNLDAMAAHSARLANFYVSPVCTPTRAALMTGRHPQRTRAIDTWIGRAMMDPDEITIAEVLGEAGWATGIFGKWHLGDCYPMRAMDQGFQESLVLRGGGIGQPADPLGAEGRYTDPILQHNGQPTLTKGYCTDVFFDAAIEWMRQRHEDGRPFFTYLPTNAPHGPFRDVPPKLLEKYRAMNLDFARYPQSHGHKLPKKPGKNLARIFAMIENVDQNIGKLFAALREMGALENTLILFLNDNGPATRRYVRGHRGKKSEVYEGGVRSPLLAHWPGRLAAGLASKEVAVHYDLLPTILAACEVAVPRGLRLDGRNILPLLERDDYGWADREIFLQSHRGDVPVRFHNFMVRNRQYKLLNASGFGRERERVEPQFELYDLQRDPYEMQNIAAANPNVVARLRSRYEMWFEDVTKTRPNLGVPPAIYLGAKASPRVVLTRQDIKRESRGSWGGRMQGYWRVNVVKDGVYRIRIVATRNARPKQATLQRRTTRVGAAMTGRDAVFEGVALPKGIGRLRAVCTDDKGSFAAYQVILDAL